MSSDVTENIDIDRKLDFESFLDFYLQLSFYNLEIAKIGTLELKRKHYKYVFTAHTF